MLTSPRKPFARFLLAEFLVLLALPEEGKRKAAGTASQKASAASGRGRS